MTRFLTTLALTLACVACDGSPLIPTSPTHPIPDPPPPVHATLTPIQVQGTTFVADADFRWIGVTAFDAPRRVAEGDESYLQWASQTGFTVLRVVVASVYRTPRTPGEGLAELGPFLDAAARYGLYAEVVVGVDVLLYRYHRNGFADFAKAVAEITNARTNVVIEIANEIDHPTQAAFLEDVGFQRQLIGYFTAPTSAGSTHGGDNPKWDAGAYMTHHADRRLSPEAAASGLAAAQARYRKPIVFDEGIGVAEFAVPGSRVNDPNYGATLGRALRAHGLAGTLHIESGLDARPPVPGGVEDTAARGFVQEMRR